jgi:hypothetical protein
LGSGPENRRRAAGRGYDAFTTGVGNVIGTNRELVALSLAVRASASTRSMKISASMAVPPKFCFHQLVASNPVRDLLIRAKHLFVAAKPGRVQEAAANRRGSGSDKASNCTQ